MHINKRIKTSLDSLHSFHRRRHTHYQPHQHSTESVAVHYNTLHCDTLKFIILQYITLWYIDIHYNTSHFLTLSHITSNLLTLHTKEGTPSTFLYLHYFFIWYQEAILNMLYKILIHTRQWPLCWMILMWIVVIPNIKSSKVLWGNKKWDILFSGATKY